MEEVVDDYILTHKVTCIYTFVNKRALTVLKKNGYKTYNYIKSLTLEDFLKMDGMGEVSAHKLLLEIEKFELILKCYEHVKEIGAEKL